MQCKNPRRSTWNAARIHAAVDKTLNEDNVRTGDLGGKATTRELTQAIVRRLG